MSETHRQFIRFQRKPTHDNDSDAVGAAEKPLSEIGTGMHAHLVVDERKGKAMQIVLYDLHGFVHLIASDRLMSQVFQKQRQNFR